MNLTRDSLKSPKTPQISQTTHCQSYPQPRANKRFCAQMTRMPFGQTRGPKWSIIVHNTPNLRRTHFQCKNKTNDTHCPKSHYLGIVGPTSPTDAQKIRLEPTTSYSSSKSIKLLLKVHGLKVRVPLDGEIDIRNRTVLEKPSWVGSIAIGSSFIFWAEMQIVQFAQWP